MIDLTDDDLIVIARKTALNCTHRYNYMPVLEEQAKVWFPHRWVISAMREAISSADDSEQDQIDPVSWQIRSMTDRSGSYWSAWRECSEMERAMHSHEVGRFNQFGIMREIRPLYVNKKSKASDTHTMRSVMDAIQQARGFPVLTSNQCHSLAESLNYVASLNEAKE